ncbi:MAG: HD domain-containing protein [Deltaproteobacteria bacterium]|nr:MAG: HD domain-containing protein [Deltaproteobacteria bacterium]
METAQKLDEMDQQSGRSHKNLEVINSLLRLSLENLPLREPLELTLDLLTSIPWIGLLSKGAVFSVENHGQEVLVLQAQKGLGEELLATCSRVPFGFCLCGLAASTRQIQFAADLDDRHQVHFEGMPRHGHYCVPILLNGRLLGVMNLYVKAGHVRHPIDEEFLSSVANTLAGIIARREAEEARLKSEREFHLLLKNVPALVFKGYADGAANFFDDRVEEMTGYARGDFESRKLKWTDLIIEEDRGETRAQFIKALKGLKSYVREYRINSREEKTLWIQERSQIVLNRAGKIDYISGVLFDISRRKRGEEALKKSFEQLQKTLRGTVKALGSALEMRDPYTSGHQRRVAQLACAIGKELGLSGEQIEGMRMIGFLHDIGKIAVPAEILTKPGRINAHEFSLIKMHAEAGFDILKEIDFPCPVAESIAQHHERLDGSGYPKGLSGPEILLQARILAVADVVEAMSSHRPYRPGLGIETALKEVTNKKGSHFDPEVVEACVRLFTEKGFNFE